MERRRRKRKSKKLKIVLWSLSILLVIGVAGLFAANYAIDKVLGSLVDDAIPSVALADSTTGQELSEVTPDKTSDPSTSLEGNQSTDKDTNVDAAGEKATESTTDDSSATNTKPSNNTNASSTTVPSEDKSEVDLNTYSATVSAEKAEAIQEEVTLKEKATVASVLLGSLSGSDISTLQSMASGGLTIEEKKKAKAILLEKLTEDQYDQLIAIAAKYGVSQGKKYSDSKKETTP